MLDVYLALGDERVSVATGKGTFAPCHVHGREYYPVAIVERDIQKLIDYLVTDFNLVSSDDVFVNVIPNEDKAFTNAVIEAAREACSGCDAADLTEIMARALARLSERPELETGEFGVNYLGKSFVMRDGKVARGPFDPFALRLSGAELFSCLSESCRLPDPGEACSLDDMPFEIELDEETRAAIDREFAPYARRLARIAENMKDHPHTTIERSDEADEQARRAERVRSLLAHAKVFSDEETAAGLCEAVSSCVTNFEKDVVSSIWVGIRRAVCGLASNEMRGFSATAARAADRSAIIEAERAEQERAEKIAMMNEQREDIRRSFDKMLNALILSDENKDELRGSYTWESDETRYMRSLDSSRTPDADTAKKINALLGKIKGNAKAKSSSMFTKKLEAVSASLRDLAESLVKMKILAPTFAPEATCKELIDGAFDDIRAEDASFWKEFAPVFGRFNEANSYLWASSSV